jgi:ferritin
MPALDPVVRDALNRQYTTERQSSALYEAISNRFSFLNLPGLAHFADSLSCQKAEQADKLRGYVLDRYGFPVLDALPLIDPPQADMLTAARVLFAYALMREQMNTESLKTLYDLAVDADDPQTCQFLLCCLKHQTSVEAQMSELAARAQFAEGCAAAVLMLDHDLGE